MMGVMRCGMPSYMVSSTRFGSMRMRRTSSGRARIMIDVMSPLMQVDLPAPASGDEDVRHAGEVGDDVVALHILAEADQHGVVV